MHRPTTLLACALAAIIAAPVTASANPKRDARAKFTRAMKAHKEGRFDDALVDLEASYKLDPRPELLYAMGQIYVKLGKCSDAESSYQRFLATNKDRDMASLVRQALHACKPAADPPPPPEPPAVATAVEPPRVEPAVAPPPPSAPIEPPPPPAPMPPRPSLAAASGSATVAPVEVRAHWYSDKLGDALVIGGVAAAAVGVVLYRRALSDLDAAEGSTTLDRYTSLTSSAHTDRTYSIVLGGGAVLLVGAGIVHYALHGRTKETSGVGLAPVRGGGLVTWTGGL
jgi:tetratricopeptide (TPR) repeat protein